MARGNNYSGARWAFAQPAPRKYDFKRGDRFVHARQIDRDGNLEVCEITAVRNGAVYFRNSTGYKSVVAIKGREWPSALDPERTIRGNSFETDTVGRWLIKNGTAANTVAREGADRCFCGCKYWEGDRCIDCGTHVTAIPEGPDGDGV